jgi:hypothetical protein
MPNMEEEDRLLSDFADYLLLIDLDSSIALTEPEWMVYMRDALNIGIQNYGREYGEELFCLLKKRLSDYSNSIAVKITPRIHHGTIRQMPVRKEKLSKIEVIPPPIKKIKVVHSVDDLKAKLSARMGWSNG